MSQKKECDRADSYFNDYVVQQSGVEIMNVNLMTREKLSVPMNPKATMKPSVQIAAEKSSIPDSSDILKEIHVFPSELEHTPSKKKRKKKGKKESPALRNHYFSRLIPLQRYVKLFQ